MRARGVWLAGVAALALGACARHPAPAVSSPDATVRMAALPRYIEIVGPRAQHAPPFLGVPETNFFVLRSWLDRESGRATTQLYVSDSYEGPQKGWNAAYGPAGTALPFVAIRRDEIGCRRVCAWVEDFAARIPEHRLDAASGGLAVTFAALSGATKTVTVTPRQIHAQRAAIAAARLRSPE
ncbi:MAG TPA: hypothetical protein VE993_21310 [Stellaceae bacterium]|nr:hypothetical protein [Stellaceae bacterium]